MLFRSKGKAVDAQGRALEGLRQGMQGMQQQMAQQRGQGQGDGEGDPDDYADGDDDGPRDGQPRQGNGNPRDPLDRQSQFNQDRQRGGILSGEAAAQRAYKVLEELRRRLGDPSRPREELDYLERLMRRF